MSVDWHLISWLFTFLSVLGAIYNAKKRVLGFYIWIAANIGWVAYDSIIGEWAQAALFLVYTGISVYGIIQWRKSK